MAAWAAAAAVAPAALPARGAFYDGYVDFYTEDNEVCPFCCGQLGNCYCHAEPLEEDITVEQFLEQCDAAPALRAASVAAVAAAVAVCSRSPSVRVPDPVQKVVERPEPYPVDKVVEVPQPYPVQKVVERRVDVPQVVQVREEVRVPYTVERVVDRPMPTPVAREVVKYVDRPVPQPYEVKVPHPYEVKVPVEQIRYRDVPVPVSVRS